MRSVAITLATVLAVGSFAMATVTGWDIAADSDGVIDCTTSFSLAELELTINGDQFSQPTYGVTGHVLGSFETNDTDDPTIGVINTIDNETDFVWTDYHINLYMEVPFAIDAASVLDPTDWTTTIVQPSSTAGSHVDAHGNSHAYLGTIDYYAGTGVDIGDPLEFTYTFSFDGYTYYAFCQEMTPTPEPATMSLLALGAIGLLRRRR